MKISIFVILFVITNCKAQRKHTHTQKGEKKDPSMFHLCTRETKANCIDHLKHNKAMLQGIPALQYDAHCDIWRCKYSYCCVPSQTMYQRRGLLHGCPVYMYLSSGNLSFIVDPFHRTSRKVRHDEVKGLGQVSVNKIGIVDVHKEERNPLTNCVRTLNHRPFLQTFMRRGHQGNQDQTWGWLVGFHYSQHDGWAIMNKNT